jgi:hypothetical protein
LSRSPNVTNIGTSSFGGHYSAQKSKLLKGFDKTFRKYGGRILVQHYNDNLADQILLESRREYEALIPKIPDVGGKKNINEKPLI